MTRKVYKSAMGKTVDMGSLLLQNERVRAVGNMNVNARGDRLDSNNQIVEPKNQQVQRRYRKQTNVSAGPAHSSTRSAKETVQQPMVDPADSFLDLPIDEPFVEPGAAPGVVESSPVSPEQQVNTPDAAAQGSGGLAGAIARSREVKQELEKTRRQQAQAQGVRRI
jgi:predicted component of type VI protein secretion system